MSRIRSQLETLRRNQAASDPRPSRSGPDTGYRDRAPMPVSSDRDYRRPRDIHEEARRPAPAASSTDMDRIRDRIDQLATVVGQMAATQSATRTMNEQQARQQLPSQPVQSQIDPATQAAIATAAKMSAQTSAQIEQMQQEMSELKSALVHIVRQPAAPDLSGDLRRIAEGVARLQEPNQDSGGHLEDVAMELHQMRQAIMGISQENSAPDPQSIVRSIEDGYAQIAGRLETVMARQPAEPDSRQLSVLADHVTAMREMVEQLPLRIPVDEMNGRIEQIGESLAQLSGRGDQSILKNFRQLENRLDEVTRALVAVSVSPGGNFENDALDRIEARLSAMVKTLETMPVSAAHNAVGGFDATPAFDDIARQLSDIASRFDTFAPMANHQDPWGPTILDRIDEISRQLASAPEKAGTPFADAELSKRIMSEFSQLSQRVEALRTEAANNGDDLSNVIMGELSELSARMDSLRAISPNEPGVPNTSLRSIEDQISILVDRIDQMAGATAAQPFADERLAALEDTLGQIAHRLNTVSGDGVDFSPLAERLESIEQQVSVSQNLAMDAATQAAERVFQMAGQMTSPAVGSDPQFLEHLTREIQTLESQARELADRNTDGFETIRQMLETIGQRIEGIEADIREATSEPRQDEYAQHNGQHDGYTSHETNVRSSMERSAQSERGEGRLLYDAPVLAGDKLPDFQQSANWDDMDNGQAVPDHEVGPTVEMDDVPLEPGSGVPDLAALVRDASQRRKASTLAGDADKPAGPHDFLAAARRAAQAATLESAAPPAAETMRDRIKAKSQSSAAASLLKNRKLLMAAAAAVLLLAIAVPVASSFFGREPKIVDADASLQQQSTTAQDNSASGETPKVDDQNIQTQQAGQLQVRPVEDVVSQAATGNEQGPAQPATSLDGETTQADATLADIPPVPQEAGNPVLREAAAAGDPSALFEIGRRYTDGEGVKRDLATAAIWYEASARSGSAPAQYRFANFLEKGHGVPLDVEKSALWYQRAAEQGNALAMHNLAVIHTSGLIGGKPDMESALGWFEKAAELGVKDSQVNLGIIYAKGLGVEADLVAAYKWLSVAARGGDADAAAKRDTLASAMRPDQLEKARGAAETWKPETIDPIANVAVVLPEWKDGAGESAGMTPPSASSGNGTAPVAGTDTKEVTREMIAKVQSLLAGMGYDPGPADGQIGARTRDAVKAFQKKAGMPADGEISSELFEKLAGNAA